MTLKSKYWEERLILNQHRVGSKRMEKEILKLYKGATKEIKAGIADLWLKLLQNGELSQASLYQYGRYINIQQQINEILTKLGQQEISVMNAQLQDLYDKTFLESARYLGGDSLSLVNTRNAIEVVNANFKGATFSDRIWKRRDLLTDQLMISITNSAVVGKDWKTVSRDLSRHMEVGLSDSNRLVRTETMRVLNDSCTHAAADRGYKTYHLLVESDACDECKELENETFEIHERVLPVHPHCKCCVVIDV